jgi:acetylornithine/succinyldiaminopimelate/putrescine aminotransferase
LLPGFIFVPFNDLAALEKATEVGACAVLLEPIQGEGGVCLPKPGFLTGVRQICDKKGLLLVLDEVQTGLGRTGRLFAHEHYGLKPDIMTLAKALGGGIAVGGMVARSWVADKLKPGTHAATFGGNPVACRAALAALETIQADGLLERAQQIGTGFQQRLDDLKNRCALIRQVRIKGAMIGIELAVEGGPLVNACLQRRLLINCTHGTVLRLLPALTLTDQELDEGFSILEEVLLAHKLLP